MAWIKRNLFFVIGGVIALGLLGAAGYYIYKGWDRNEAAYTSLTEVVGNLKTLTDTKPSPGNKKIDNTAIAKEQDKELQAWNASASAYFQPIAPIPAGALTSEAYAGALRRTIDQLQKQAETAGVMLPPKYDFSFSAQRSLVKFAGGIDLLATQLGEVKTICEIMFAAKVNSLDGIQRVRVTDDDTQGAASDYFDERPVTNETAIITPYIISFHCFTPELSRVMGGFATASNTYIVKAYNVQPASANGQAGDMPPGMQPPPGMLSMPPGVQPVAGKGGLQTVLKEQLLQVTMEVGLVKLLPKN